MVDLYSMSCSKILLGLMCLFPGFYIAFLSLLSANNEGALLGLALTLLGIFLIWWGRGRKIKDAG
ncbi:MAG: hypothetical protein JXB47_19145 [Anaerolineae bacterium]|nr:hypothetical protein [Anaerolineae bacterium]